MMLILAKMMILINPNTMVLVVKIKILKVMKNRKKAYWIIASQRRTTPTTPTPKNLQTLLNLNF